MLELNSDFELRFMGFNRWVTFLIRVKSTPFASVQQKVEGKQD